jgi:large subunit ribosomal protein L10
MASEKILQTKKEAVEELVKKLNAAKSGVLVDYIGINVADDTKLRRELREAGVEYAVVKNSILRFASKEAGYEGLDAFLSGSTAIALSNDDPIAPAKILGKFADDSKGKFSLKGGFIDGEVIDETKVSALAKMPSKEEILTMIVIALSSPVKGIAVALDKMVKKNGGDEGEVA